MKSSILSCAIIVTLSLGAPNTVYADSATWNLHPANANWYHASNWTPATVPNGPSDVATLPDSDIIAIRLPKGSHTILDSLIFDVPSEPSGGVLVGKETTLTFVGAGVINKQNDLSGIRIEGGGSVTFLGSAMADCLLAVFNGHLNLRDDSVFVGFINAYGSFESNGHGGTVVFSDRATVEGDITINGSVFEGDNGGRVYFNDDCLTNGSFILLAGNGRIDLSGHNPPGISIETLDGEDDGTGFICLGSNNLTIDSSLIQNESTIHATIQDGGRSGGNGGSITKNGTSSLTLSGSNTYTGSTTINAGTFLVNNPHGSGTGTGAVQINAGTLGGTGRIAGSVTLGTGSGNGAFLVPGVENTPVSTLTIQGSLLLASDSTYNFDLSLSRVTADSVVANGVTIESNAQFLFNILGHGTLPLGTVFIVIDNTAANSIQGAFSNLSDGDIITTEGGNLQVSYEGGDGNDLTLTVVPQ